jgi:hypothetical protein
MTEQLQKQMTKFHLLVLAFLQVLDVMTTCTFLKMGMQEANWLVSSAANPYARMLELKLLLMGYAIWLAKKSFHQHPKFLRILWWSNLFYMLVVIWNLFWIMKKLEVF